MAAKIYCKYTILGRSGGVPGFWALHELSELRKKGRVGRYTIRIRSLGYVISKPRRQLPKTRDYVAPINLCGLQKWRDCPRSRFQPGAAVDDVYNTDAHKVLTLPTVPRTILEAALEIRLISPHLVYKPTRPASQANSILPTRICADSFTELNSRYTK